jgi:hypothetical protein
MQLFVLYSLMTICVGYAFAKAPIQGAGKNRINLEGEFLSTEGSDPTPFGDVRGTFDITGFHYPGTGRSGTLVGTLHITQCAGSADACGQIAGKKFENYDLPISVPSAPIRRLLRVDRDLLECPILHLSLGPLDLDLLGLVVTLNRLNLNVLAQAGRGELLGNLLCAVANLLNGSGLLSNVLDSLTGLINSLLQL